MKLNVDFTVASGWLHRETVWKVFWFFDDVVVAKVGLDWQAPISA
jgi:hypothetical protein